MIKKYSYKIFISLIVLSLLAIALTGCVDIIIPGDTGTVRVTLSGTFYYDIKIDGATKLSNKAPGTYNITGVPTGYRTI
jgi:hypothetical protein